MVTENNEVWKDIPGWHPYQASDLGNIRNPITGRSLKKKVNSWGYAQVARMKCKPGDPMQVNRIVALTFLGKPPVDRWGMAYFVNHKDGDKSNDRLGNLEYLSTGENTQHYHHEIRPAELDKVAKLLGLKTWRQVEFAIIRKEINLSWVDNDAL
jgi:hypothetical protein